jgi:hypothetical protein
MPTTQADQDEIHRLAEKVKTCFGMYHDATLSSEEYASSSTTPLENETCLINAIGFDAFQDVYSGIRHPTYEENIWFRECYENQDQSPVSYSTQDQGLPDEAEACLTNIVGEDLFQKIKTGIADVPYELRSKVDRCFGVKLQPFDEGPVYDVPDEIKSCLEQAVGKDRFNEISAGRSEPTVKEKEAAWACFEKLNKVQSKFVPLPATQIPYLDEESGVIGMDDVEQDIGEIGGEKVGKKIVFKGNGPPNSVVNIYIFSDPIVVTTKVDENGEWIYELNQPLTGEKHVAYATVRSQDGKVVRSSIFSFEVIAADKPITKPYLEESKATQVSSNFIKYAFMLMGVGVVFVMGAITFINLKKLNIQKELVGKDGNSLSGGVDGKSKDNPGSRSVN